MGFMDFLRNVGSKIAGGAKKVFGVASRVAGHVKHGAGRVFGAGAKIADTVKDLYHKAENIPVIGQAIKEGANQLKNVQIPRTGLSIGQALSGADKIVHTGDRILNR